MHHKSRVKLTFGKLGFLHFFILHFKIFKMIYNLCRFGVKETAPHQSQDDVILNN